MGSKNQCNTVDMHYPQKIESKTSSISGQYPSSVHVVLIGLSFFRSVKMKIRISACWRFFARLVRPCASLRQSPGAKFAGAGALSSANRLYRARRPTGAYGNFVSNRFSGSYYGCRLVLVSGDVIRGSSPRGRQTARALADTNGLESRRALVQSIHHNLLTITGFSFIIFIMFIIAAPGKSDGRVPHATDRARANHFSLYLSSAHVNSDVVSGTAPNRLRDPACVPPLSSARRASECAKTYCFL